MCKFEKTCKLEKFFLHLSEQWKQTNKHEAGDVITVREINFYEVNTKNIQD